MVSGGCIISGELNHSLLFSKCRIHSYASVDSSVLLPEVVVGRGVRLNHVIVDHGCTIPDGMIIGENAELDSERFHRTERGITLDHQRNAEASRCRLMAAISVLHVAAEAYPLIKTGGLADVAGALPPAQRATGMDARLLLPGYPAVLSALRANGDLQQVGATHWRGFRAARICLLRGQLPGSDLPVYAIDAPWLYARPGNPYVDATGLPWSDNYLRFGLSAL